MRNFYITLLSLLFFFSGFSQVELIPAANGGFENATSTLAANGWTAVNHTNNTWVVGTTTFANGTKSAYISNNGGSSYTYSNSTRTSHFYRNVTIPAGATDITLSFNWRSAGELGWDRFMVFTAPTSVTPVAGTPSSPNETITGATQVFKQTVLQGASYTTETISLPSSLAGTTIRLIFTWQSDASGSAQPPASIDDVSLTYIAGATITGLSSTSGCEGTAVLINGTNFTGATAVKFGGTDAASFTVVSNTQISAIPDAGATGTISVTVPAGTATSTGSFTVNPLPADVTVSGGGTFCGSTTITATGGTGGTIYYQGTNSNGTSTGATATTQTISTSGTYYFRARSSAGCWGNSSAVTVTISPLPASVSVSNAGTSCGSRTITASGGSGGTIYFQGTTNGGTLTNDPSSSEIITASGTYYFRSQSSSGCWGTQGSAVVTINPFPVITSDPSTSTQELCLNDAASQLSISATGSGLSYQWYRNTTATNTGGTLLTGATSATYTPVTTTAATYYYYCRVISSAGTCTVFSAASGAITVYAKPVANAITGATTVCAGSSITINSNATGTAPLTYTWQSSNTAVATVSNTGVVTGVAAGTANITYTVTSGDGCSSSSATRLITVNALVSVNLTSAPGTDDQEKCIGSGAITPITYLIGGTGSGASIPAGQLPAGVSGAYNSGSKVYTISGTPSVSGVFNYTITVPGTCSPATISGTLTINAHSTIALSSGSGSNIQTACASTPMNAITYIIGGGGTGATVTGLPAGLTGSYAAGVFTISGTTAVTGVFNYTVNTTGPCNQVSATGTITVLALPSGNLTASPSTICYGSPVTFNATTGYVTYLFKINGVEVQNGATANYVTSTLNAGDIVTVETFANSCPATFTAPAVTVNPLPVPSLIASSVSVCPNTNVTFTAGGGVSYIFKVDGSSVQSGVSNTYTTNTLTNGASVTVEVTNANGCKATSAPLIITVNASPSGTLTTPSTTVCAASNVTFTATGGASYQFRVNGTIVQAFSAANTYTTSTLVNASVVTVDVLSASGCPATYAGLFMTVTPLPTGTLSATENSGTSNDNIICPGLPVNFTATAGFTNYNFRVNGVSVQSGVSNAFSSTTLANADVVTVIITAASGCSATLNPVSITVLPPPAGTLAATATSICPGTNVTFTATTGYSSYNFKVNGTTVQNGASNIYSNNALTNGATVTVNVTSASGCISLFNSLVITVNPVPAGTLTHAENSGVAANDFIICAGAPVTFTATAGFTNYRFLVNGVQVQTGASNIYTTTTIANTNIVTVQVTNSFGCTSTFGSSAFTVNALPSVNPVTGTNSVCAGFTTQLANTTAGGVWSSSNTGVATVSSTGLVSGIAAGTATISYTVTNSNSCANVATSVVTVNALPVVPAITGGASVCIGSILSLGNTTPGGIWSSSNTSAATVNSSGVVTGVATGSTTITYSVTSGAGCNTSRTQVVAVNASTPLTAITGAAVICSNTSTTYTNSTVGGVWSSSNTAVATVNSTTGLVTGVAGGTANITYFFANVNGCISSVVKTITINASPVPTLTGPNPICQGSLGNVYTTQAGKTNYNWVVTNGTVTAGGTTSSNTVTISWLALGVKNITVNYTDVNGCVGATSATVANAPSPALPTISGPSTVCLNASGNVYTTETSKSFYTWVVTGGTITSGGTSTSNTATVTWTSAGARSISVNYADAFGCNAASPTVYPVTVNPLPAATVSGTVSVCRNSTQPNITFTGSNGTAPYIFTYKINGGANQVIASTGNTAVIPVNTTVAGPFVYSLVSVQDASSTTCSQAQSGSATITVNPLPAVVITNPSGVCAPATVNLTVAAVTAGSTAGLAYTYWSDAAATIAYTTPATATAGTYYIKGTNTATGCYDIKPVVVTVNPLPSVVINNPAPVCSSTVNLTLASVTAGSTAGLTYTYWTNATATTAYATPASATAGTYYIKGTTAAGCYDVEPVTVTVNPAPTVVIANPAAVCSPATANLTLAAVTSGSTAGLTFTYWTNAAATSAYATPSAATAGTYYIKGTNTTTGCFDIEPVVVTVYASPNVVINTPAGVCSPSTVNLTAAAITSGSTAGLTYTYWTNAAATVSYATPAAATAGTYYIKGTNTATGCFDIEPVTVTVNPLPVVVINAPAAVCSPATVNLTAAAITSGSTSGLTYSYWTNAAGTIAYTSPATASTGTYYIKGTTASGCINIKPVTVTVNAIPAAPVVSPATATICQGSIRILTSGTAATWSPVTDLYTDAAATIAYAGQVLTTVYAKPATAGSKVYTAAVSNGFGCTNSGSSTLTVNPTPAVTITSDYCTVAGKVRLTAATVPGGATYLWNTGQTTASIDVDIAGVYNVLATFGTGCSGTGSVNVAVELVTNGDFSAGNTGFFTEYTYTTNNLYPEGYYAIGTDANPYHANFWGKEHTTPAQTGNFMMINGSSVLIGSPARLRTIWQQTVSVLPNTNYYFSAYGMNLNPGSPAQLQFEVNGVPVGTVADLNLAPKPTSAATVNINNWLRFYSNPTWNSGSATTAVIRIINLNTDAGGNDFALDDISFSTLSTFIKLLSVTGSDAQTVCVNTAISDIVYSVGSGATGPSVTGLPAGVTAIFNGVNLTISGTPTVAGNYTYSVTTVGNCNSVTATGSIIVQAPTINLTAGTSTQTVCRNSAISNIAYTIGGTATNATVSGLPTGLIMTKSGNVLTVSGIPSVAGTFVYTITTTGTCTPVSASGTIIVQTQSVTLTSGSNTPTLCINTPLTNILYTVGGTGTGASVTGLPAGVTGVYNSGFFFISGTPSQAGTFNYIITTTGGCTAATATGTITVQQQTITLASGSATQAFCVGSPMFNIVYTIGGSATGASATGLPAGVTGVYNAGLFTISGTPSQSGTFSYTVTTSGGCVNATATGSLTSGVNTWTGTVSTNWSTAGNWSCGAVPITVTDVVIPTGAPNMPQLTTTSVSKSIVLQTGTTIDLNGQSFTNYGAVSGPGLIKGSSTSQLTINAPSTSSTLNFSQAVDGTSNALGNLTISGASSTVTLNNRLTLYGVLSPASGTLTINNTLVLRSTSTGTARVAPVTGAITYGVSGIVDVERYFPARRAWRLFTAPVAYGGQVYDNWQNGGVYNAGRGTYVSGPGATSPTGVNGLDWSPMNNYSLKAGSALTPVSNTHTALLSKSLGNAADNLSYFIFVRGDRVIANTNPANSNTTTLSSKGKLQTGTQTFPLTAATNAFTLVGNPYASPVDMKNIVRTNITNRYYVWDPYINVEQGGYIVFDDFDNNGVYDAVPPSTLSQSLQSGQAFFTQTMTNAPASVVFNETAKSSTNNLLTFRPMGSGPATMRVNLYHLNENDSTVLLDGIMAQFDNSFNTGVDMEDAVKGSNIKENIGLRRDLKNLTIERRPVPVGNDTLYLQLSRVSQRNYRLRIEPLNMENSPAAYLEDNYSGVSTPLSNSDNSVVDFIVNAEAASAATDRFKIVFKQVVVIPEPVTKISLRAYQQVKNIVVAWSVENERNIKTYEVEKSADGISFEKVSSAKATGLATAASPYKWLDETPFSGNNYYRIRSINADGKFDYTSAVLVKMEKLVSGIRIYPNPVTDGIIGAEFKNMDAGIYSVRLINSHGQTILNKTVNHAAGTSMENIKSDYKLPAGVYQLEVISPLKEISQVKVIVK